MSSFSGPSSVVVLQQLPEGCSDADIRRVMSSFGQVVEIQMHYARNQAEVRLASPQQATTALQQRVVHLHGIAVALDAAAPLQVAPQPYHSGTSGHHHHHHQQQQPSLGWYGPPAHHTVHVVVEQCTYPISRDVLAEVFSRIGQPTSIQCGPSNLGGTTIGAVTFADPAAAQQAIQDLNAKQIYPGCCTMRLQLGAVAATGPPSPPAASLLSFQGPALVPAAPMGYHHPGNYVAHDSFASQPHNVSPMHMMAPPPFVSQQYPPPGVAGANQMTGYGGTSRGGRGGRGRGSGLQAPGHHHHHHHHHHLHQHDFTSQLYQHHQYHQHHHQHHHHHHQHFPSPHHHHAMHGAMYGGAQLEAAVLIVSNVPEHVPLQSLWVLLEVYGNVNSLRRQHTHKDNVVAHFQHLHDARGVVAHLQNCPFFGSCLQLKHFAGYQDRGAGKVEWNVGPATDPAVHACQFHGSHHRTKPSAPYNPKQKNRPDCNLFVSNLTDAINDEHIRDLFEQRGYKVEDLYRKSPTSAIVQLESVEKAVEALVETHAVQLGGRYVSVAFSRFPPGPGPVAAAAAAVVEGGTSETHQTSADES